MWKQMEEKEKAEHYSVTNLNSHFSHISFIIFVSLLLWALGFFKDEKLRVMRGVMRWKLCCLQKEKVSFNKFHTSKPKGIQLYELIKSV